jgi:hypothetical protein
MRARICLSLFIVQQCSSLFNHLVVYCSLFTVH